MQGKSMGESDQNEFCVPIGVRLIINVASVESLTNSTEIAYSFRKK